MDFSLTAEQNSLIDAVDQTIARFDDDYWSALDRSGEYPEAFFQAMATGGWLGMVLPEAFGGSGLGVTEASLMMTQVARRGGMAAASSIHMNIFGPKSLVAHATPAQQQRWLPGIIAGETKMCFAVTEPNSGLDTTRLQTSAKREGDSYRVNGHKLWISAAQQAHKIMLIARTAPRDDANPTAGLSLFFTDLDRSKIEIREIDKMGRAAVNTNQLFIDDLQIPVDDLVGEEGMGFRYLLQSLNPERVLLASEAIGIGLDALDRATRYAKERVVFDRPIGQNQSIQHPLAAGWARLQAARLMTLNAAALYDQGKSCGVEANAAKYLAAEAGVDVCRQAMATHGGMGYSREYQIERLFREIMIPYLAPVSQQLVLCYLAERALGLPKSY